MKHPCWKCLVRFGQTVNPRKNCSLTKTIAFIHCSTKHPLVAARFHHAGAASLVTAIDAQVSSDFSILPGFEICFWRSLETAQVIREFTVFWDLNDAFWREICLWISLDTAFDAIVSSEGFGSLPENSLWKCDRNRCAVEYATGESN